MPIIKLPSVYEQRLLLGCPNQRLIFRTKCIWLGTVYKGRPANGEGGGFEISDIPGRGEGGWFVKIRTTENF